MAKTKKIVIDRKMNLGELVQASRKVGRILAEDYGLHCVGCFASSFDTLEQGMKVHGYSDKDVDKAVKRLNQVIQGKKK